MPRRHENLWWLPMDVGSPLDASSSGAAMRTASENGKDSIQIAASSSAQWAVIAPSRLGSFDPQKDVYVTFRLDCKSTLSSGVPQLIFTYYCGYTATVTIALPTGSYDWTECNYRAIIYGGRIAGGISQQTLKVGVSTAGSGSISVSGLRITLAEEPKDRIPGTDPGHITTMRGMNFHPLVPKSQLVASKRDYKTNIIRYQIFPSAYDVPPYSTSESPTDTTKFRAWWDKRMSDLESVLVWARQTDHKVVVAIMTVLGSATANMSAAPTQLIHDEYLRCCRDLATRLYGNISVYAIELFNEPTYPANPPSQGPFGHNYWSMQMDGIQVIREIDPSRKLMVAYAGTGDIYWMRFIETVKEYDNIDYVVHGYTPFAYVDQAGTAYSYPGTLQNGDVFDAAYMRAMLQPARDIQLETGSRIFVTEFSFKRWNPGADAATAQFIALCEEYGWDWMYFAYIDPVATDPQQAFSLEHDPLPAHATGVLSVSPSPMKVVVRDALAQNSSLYTAEQQAPAPPTSPAFTQPYSDQIRLAWTAPITYATGFRVEYKEHSSYAWIVAASSQAPGDTDFFLFSGMAVGTEYDFRVTTLSPYGDVQGEVWEFTPSFVDPYSGITKFAARYSIRKIVPTYSGPCIRVRRSSDSTEQDIGFTSSGNLDTAALLSFVGSGDGFVSVLYAQYGSTNYVQATTTKQPRIVLAGVVDVGANGLPSIVFRGTDYLDQSSLFLVGSANSVCGVLQAAADNPAQSYFFSESAAGGAINYSLRTNATDGTTASVMVRNDANTLQVGNSFAGVSGHKLFDASIHRFERYDTLTSIGYYIEDYQYNIQNYTRAGTYTPTKSRIGGFADGTSGTWRGRMQELLLATSVLSSADRAILKAGQTHEYGL